MASESPGLGEALSVPDQTWVVDHRDPTPSSSDRQMSSFENLLGSCLIGNNIQRNPFKIW